jgi:hypothetical protein
MRKFFFVFALLASTLVSSAQTDPFQIYLEPMSIESLPGIQSFAYGQYNGLWVIIGGRKDGLHQRQPFASFLPEGCNTEITVVDPVTKKVWRAPLTSLSIPLQDQMSSTNMEFHQEGDYLYLIGGYGYSRTIDSKLTYALITAVDLRGVIYAVQQKSNLAPFFRQVTDQQFAVTGGYLHTLGNTFYLIGGQKFDGNYNPMNHPTFNQSYTNAIRKFMLEDDGVNLKITHLSGVIDTAAFHRRDYNVVPQLFPDGKEGLTAFAGVFQVNADIPILDAVNIADDGYAFVSDFAQYYNHYHCANMPLYSTSTGEMHTIFFGGIAQYYEHEGILTEDSDVPFVTTIARVTRDRHGRMAEYKLPSEMPQLLGASAAFIPARGIPAYENGVIKLDELTTDSMMVGYIYGGIKSNDANIFWVNDGTESVAQNVLYKVYVLRGANTTTHILNPQSTNGTQLQIYPNPAEKTFTFVYHLDHAKKVLLTVTTEQGKSLLVEDISSQLVRGNNRFTKEIKSFKIGGVYLVTVTTDGVAAMQRIVVKE